MIADWLVQMHVAQTLNMSLRNTILTDAYWWLCKEIRFHFSVLAPTLNYSYKRWKTFTVVAENVQTVSKARIKTYNPYLTSVVSFCCSVFLTLKGATFPNNHFKLTWIQLTSKKLGVSFQDLSLMNRGWTGGEERGKKEILAHFRLFTFKANLVTHIRRTGPCGYRTLVSQTPMADLLIWNELHASLSRM